MLCKKGRTTDLNNSLSLGRDLLKLCAGQAESESSILSDKRIFSDIIRNSNVKSDQLAKFIELSESFATFKRVLLLELEELQKQISRLIYLFSLHKRPNLMTFNRNSPKRQIVTT